MNQELLTKNDLKQLKQHGLPACEALRQLNAQERPRKARRLLKAAKIGSGIFSPSHNQQRAWVRRYTAAAARGRASGFILATEQNHVMFDGLLGAMVGGVAGRSQRFDNRASQELKFLCQHIDRFPFYPALCKAFQSQGLSIEQLHRPAETLTLLECLLTSRGLDLMSYPEGLLPLHRYGKDTRTAFDEHLTESIGYLIESDHPCRLRLAIPEQFKDTFRAAAKATSHSLGKALGVDFEIHLSSSTHSDDLLVIDPKGHPFRLHDGRLLFRPSGTGAWIEDLGHQGGDLVFIKKMNNVRPVDCHPLTTYWQKVLGGCLAAHQDRVFHYLRYLKQPWVSRALLREALAFATSHLGVMAPQSLNQATKKDLQVWLVDQLDRPLRVCGMIEFPTSRHTRPPTSSPFWMEDNQGVLRLQIVEEKEVVTHAREPKELFEQSTHFNPTQIVVGLRDLDGRPYDLSRYVDHQRGLVSHQYIQGHELRMIDRPGLWNGAMAGWNSIFVEIPTATFAPVETLCDLLRPEHQPLALAA